MADFGKDVDIDENDLTEELVRQPQKFYDWAKRAALASIDTTTAKDKVDLVKAEVELRIRKHPTLHDLPENPKEGMIKASVLVNKKVQRAIKKYHKALRNEKLLVKAERSFEHRKKSLEGLVYRSNQFYFANPKTDLRTRQRIEEKSLLEQARERRQIRRRA